MHKMLNLQYHLQIEHLIEFRLGDVSYALLQSNLWMADQVKSSRIKKDGSFTFRVKGSEMKIEHMIKILESNMSLTCIGMDRDYHIEIVWLLHGQSALRMLKTFHSSQGFHPRRTTDSTRNPFLKLMNAPDWRYDIGDSQKERLRLVCKYKKIVEESASHSLTFLNEHDSQIPSNSNRIEHLSFEMTRAALRSAGVEAKREAADSCGPVDFRVDNARIQDKCGKSSFNMRKPKGYPYNPDDIDIFQVSCMSEHVVYAFPMRIPKGSDIVSFFSEKELIVTNYTMTKKWKVKNMQYRYDFKSDADINKYISDCRSASNTPMLSHREFYSDMIKSNKCLFNI